MPASTLSCPPSSIFMEKYIKDPNLAPKPNCSPTKVPIVKDIATFECDLIDNDDAQIISTRQASVQSHRRMESQDRLIKFNRGQNAVSNERDYALKTDRVFFKRALTKPAESSPYCSPKCTANYLQINLAK